MSEIIPLAEVAAIAPSGQFVSYPGSPFELYQPYPPAGDQPVAIEQLVEGVHDGEVFQTLLGVTGSGKTFTMANVIAQLGRPAIVFAPNKTLAAQLYSEFREFFPKNAVEYFVSYYDYYQPEAYVPQRDLFIEKDSAINEHIEQMRLSCTKSIMERRDVVIVATVSAIYGIGEPESYHRMIMTLRTGDKLGQRDVIAQLIRMQYTRNEVDFSRGAFRVRGDTIDVFPAEHSELALRTPYLLNLLKERGNEILCHGWNMDSLHYGGMPEAEEQALISRSLHTLRDLTGQPITGWLSPARNQSEHTLALLADQGIQYCADWVNDDMPYRYTHSKKPLWALPLSTELEDFFILGNNLHSESSYVQQIEDACDLLLQEATTQGGRLLALNIHPWLLGQPHRIGYLEKLLAYLSQQPVWNASGSDIVQAFAAQQQAGA